MDSKPLYTVGSILRLPFGHMQRYEVNAIAAQNGATFYRFNLATGDCFTAHKWYAEDVLRKHNPVLFTAPLPGLRSHTVVVATVVHNQAQPVAQARRYAMSINTAMGKAVMVSAGLAIGTTTDTMRKRAAAAAGYCFALARNSEGERRAQLALAGGLLYGASFAPKAAQLLSAVESARQVLARAWLASNREINKAQEEVA